MPKDIENEKQSNKDSVKSVNIIRTKYQHNKKLNSNKPKSSTKGLTITRKRRPF